jgi:flagellar hook protein FlgE
MGQERIMSLFGALDTAVSGLTAQSAAFSNISDNVANSQTVGFKGVDTAFSDYLTTSTATVNDSGTVGTTPQYENNVQGTIAQSSDSLAMAISGQGFFPVSLPTGSASGVTSFSPTPYYTRAGDFEMNSDGYLVNSAGNYLDGWSVNSTTGVVSQNATTPIQVSQTAYNPVATSTVSLSANLPATPAATTDVSSQIDVYDSLGTSHGITLNWTQSTTAPNSWTVQIVSPDDQNTSPTNAVTDASGNHVIGTADVTFGADGSNLTSGGTGTAASLDFTSQFAAGNTQTISLNLGNFGQANGVTQYAGTTYSLNSITQDGVPPGSFSGVSITSAGSVVVNYDNGQSRTIAQVPLVTFNNPDALQSQNGQAYTATQDSGTPRTEAAGTNGAGSIVTGSVEDSNVDIATQFTQMIVAQNAYAANAKVVTTANTLLQDTLNILQ